MTRMTGARYLAEALNGYEVTHVFFVPAILRRMLVEMEERTQIQRIRTNGEKAAVYMADGYARASGKPGVCMAQNVGALNIAAGLRDAHLACSPVIAFTGGRTPLTKFRKVYQENDDLPAFDKVTKLNVTIDHVSRIPDLLRMAFRLATSGTPGPVHLQFEGQEGEIDFQEADLVFYIGSQTGGMTTNVWQVPPIGKPAVQLDINPEALGKNYPLKASILGDAKVSLQKLVEVVKGVSAKSRKDWIKRVKTVLGEWREEFSPFFNSDAVPIRPERICKELTELLPSDALFVADTGHSGMWTGGFFDLTKPGQSYIRSGGHLGWAFPAALGAKCACPERSVFCFTGDAGFLYHIGEIETAVRWGIKAVILVNNNYSGNQGKLGFDQAYGGKPTEKSFELWGLSKVNFAKVAESFGAMGIRVERPSELKGAMERAFSANQLVVIDVVTDIDVSAPLAFV
jgi:thiamine pyrophosphate-dependent acetolactate synthase large subunit-like protein